MGRWTQLPRRAAAIPFRLAWRAVRFIAPLAPEEALHRTVWAGIGLVLTMAIGVGGYVLIDDFSPFDALYQTTLTLTTVGFQEVHPLSREARAFTIFLMLFGVGIALYLLTAIATMLLEGDLYRDVGARRQRRMLDQMTDHTIFVGAGRMGSMIIDRAMSEDDHFVVIDSNERAAADAREGNWLTLQADVGDVDVLRSAGVERARRLYLLTGDDGINLIATLRVKELAPNLDVVVRVNQPGREDLMRNAGAVEVLSPFEVIAQQVAASRAERAEA